MTRRFFFIERTTKGVHMTSDVDPQLFCSSVLSRNCSKRTEILRIFTATILFFLNSSVFQVASKCGLNSQHNQLLFDIFCNLNLHLQYTYHFEFIFHCRCFCPDNLFLCDISLNLTICRCLYTKLIISLYSS